jgi:hypothetical protein
MADFIPQAAAELLAHIREQYGTIPAFSEAKGLDRFKVAKAVNGELQRVDVDFALDVEEATGIPAEHWRTPDDVREARKQRRAAAHRIKPGALTPDEPPASERTPTGGKGNAA